MSAAFRKCAGRQTTVHVGARDVKRMFVDCDGDLCLRREAFKNGETFFYVGASGAERVVRIASHTGNVAFLLGTRGCERIVKTQFPGLGTVKYIGPRHEERRAFLLAENGAIIRYTGLRGEERVVSVEHQTPTADGEVRKTRFAFDGPPGREYKTESHTEYVPRAGAAAAPPQDDKVQEGAAQEERIVGIVLRKYDDYAIGGDGAPVLLDEQHLF